MAKRTYEFDILAKIDGAIKSVDQLASTTQKQLDALNFKAGVSAIRDGFEIIKGVASTAFNAIEGFASKAIEESLEAEQANLKLANSLRLSGDFSAKAVQDFEKLAKSIQSTTTFTGDAVKSSVALAKQFRLTNQETEKTIRVAADLAAIQGTTLEEATQKVAQTFNGFVDKSLAKTIPGLKNLSKEALVAGDAVALIGSRVQGSAEALGDTFAGAVFRAQEAQNDLFESFGNLITQNPAIIAGIKEIQKAFEQLNEEFGKNEAGLKELVTEGFLFLVESLPAVIKSLEFIDKVVSNTVVAFFTLGRSIGAIAAAIEALTRLDFAGIKEINEAVTADNAAAFEGNASRIKNFYEPLLKTTEKLAGNIRKVAESAKESAKEVKNLGPSTSGREERQKDLFNAEDVKKKVAEIAKEPIKFAFEAAVKAQAITAKEGVAIGAGIVNNILKGADGAKKLLQEGLGAAADLILPGIGGVVSEIVGVLAQGPEEVKKQVTAFADAIPTLIENLADSLPVLIATLVEKLPPALAKAMPTVAIGFSTALIANIPKIIEGFVKGLIDAAGQFVQALIDAITGAAGDVFGAITGEGSGGIFEGIPVLGGIGDIFGFAKGGRIPDMPQYRNDGAIIRADAGEQIFNSDLTDRMERYLDANEGGGGPTYVGTIQIQMGLETFAKLSVEADRRGFRLRST